MTLEHIGQTHRFLETVRSVANRKDSVVFFQVPNVDRILKEGAFWDVYYEHCSYFSAASLKHLFTRTGFAVQRIWTGYDDQYLMIVTRPAEHGSNAPPGDADGVAAIIRMSGSFATTAARSVADPSSQLGRCRATHSSLGLRIESRRVSDYAGGPRRDRARYRYQSLPRRQIPSGYRAKNSGASISAQLPSG
jgi:hypothetical protein